MSLNSIPISRANRTSFVKFNGASLIDKIIKNIIPAISDNRKTYHNSRKPHHPYAFRIK